MYGEARAPCTGASARIGSSSRGPSTTPRWRARRAEIASAYSLRWSQSLRIEIRATSPACRRRNMSDAQAWRERMTRAAFMDRVSQGLHAQELRGKPQTHRGSYLLARWSSPPCMLETPAWRRLGRSESDRCTQLRRDRLGVSSRSSRSVSRSSCGAGGHLAALAVVSQRLAVVSQRLAVVSQRLGNRLASDLRSSPQRLAVVSRASHRLAAAFAIVSQRLAILCRPTGARVTRSRTRDSQLSPAPMQIRRLAVQIGVLPCRSGVLPVQIRRLGSADPASCSADPQSCMQIRCLAVQIRRLAVQTRCLAVQSAVLQCRSAVFAVQRDYLDAARDALQSLSATSQRLATPFQSLASASHATQRICIRDSLPDRHFTDFRLPEAQPRIASDPMQIRTRCRNLGMRPRRPSPRFRAVRVAHPRVSSWANHVPSGPPLAIAFQCGTSWTRTRLTKRRILEHD